MNTDQTDASPLPNNISPMIPPIAASSSSGPTDSPTTDSPSGRIIHTDASGKVVHDPSTVSPKYVVTPFPDGTVFRYADNPQKPGTYFLVDSNGTAVGIATNLGVAQILCEGARFWLLVAMRNAANVDKETKSDKVSTDGN